MNVLSNKVVVLKSDLLDVPMDSNLVDNEHGASEINKVMTSILTQSEPFDAQDTPPVAEALHS